MMGMFLDEIVLEQRIALGTYTFTRDNMLAYARRFDPVGFHVDEEARRASPYGAMTAAGLHVGCAWMICYVSANARARSDLLRQSKDVAELGPSPGFQNMKWLKPVYAGDVLSFFTTPVQKRPLRSRAGWGMVTGYNEGVNQHGDRVFEFASAVLTAMRGPEG